MLLFCKPITKSGETKEMVVRFEVDKDLPEDVTALTLSYTFFRAKKVITHKLNNILTGKNYGKSRSLLCPRWQ